MLELEKALKVRCANDPQYETLFAQWTFDKQLVGRALQSIPLLFPHYSLHDASHSDTILRQIARVLGPQRIERLGPTDLWLLLEAAYHHDLGMVVPHDMMQSWWRDKEFKPFLETLTNHSDDDIRHAAELLIQRDVKNKSWPFEVHRALVLVMAEFARPRHAGQARRYIEAPLLVDLQTPRTQLVPRRFWSLLGRVCECHGLKFGDAMRLPVRESGFSMDDAHPRFIACMLRLGDLLDLDDGRFCPVLARTFGGLPPSSQTHKEKHHSIEEFLVDSSEIRVVAECKNPDAFDVTEQWFSWLRQELRDQSVHWSSISPFQDFGAIPSAGRIEVRLRDYHTSADGRRPRFEIDKDSMLDFVRGAGLYTDETACIAELLQNSADATLLRLWRLNPRKWKRIQEQTPDLALDELRKHLQKYPVRVAIRDSGRSVNGTVWSIEIKDQGAGIHKDDIRYIQSVGSSRKNPRRLSRTREMPEWMKPSGFFGIGLHSVFLFTDHVTIRSRADDAMETIEIDLAQKPGTKEPHVLVRTITGRHELQRPGTCVSFSLRERTGEHPMSGGDLLRNMMSFDPFGGGSSTFLPGSIRYAVRRFADDALISICLDGALVDPVELDGGEEKMERFFDAKNSIELSLRGTARGRSSFYYRGRRVSDSFDKSFLKMGVDWHRDSAAKILTISRERVRPEQRSGIQECLDETLVRIIPLYHEKLLKDPQRLEERRYLSLAVKSAPAFAGVISDETWRDLCYDSENTVAFGEIVDVPAIRLWEDPLWSANHPSRREPQIEWSDDRRTLTIRRDRFEPWLWNLLADRRFVLRDVEAVGEVGDLRVRMEWFAPGGDGEDIVGGEKVLRYVLREAVRSRAARKTIPCSDRYLPLAFSEAGGRQMPRMVAVLSRMQPRAMFPLRVQPDGRLSLDGVEALAEWTFQFRLKKETTKFDIVSAMVRMVEDVDRLLGAGIGERKDYSVDELRRRLARWCKAD